MNNWVIGLIFISISTLTCAQSGEPGESQPAGLTSDQVLTPEELEKAEKENLALDPIEVVGEGFTFEQEVTLRMIRQAYKKKRSTKWKDRDEWICWIEEATGSHFKYLGCARNGDIWALQPNNGIGRMPTGIGGYGRIQVSTHPVNKWKLERALESLPGNKKLDKEFTNMVMAGERPPQDIPNEEEIQQFIQAYRAIGEMDASGASEDEQVIAIESSGLSVDRYNRIIDLLDVFAELMNDIGERLKAGS